jgi:hypothetical protein
MKDTVIRLQSDGVTISKIATIVNEKWGTDFKRGAISGVIDRLRKSGRITYRHTEASNIQARRNRKAIKPKPAQPKLAKPAPKATPKPSPRPLVGTDRPLPDAPDGQAKTLLEIEPGQCRWPVGHNDRDDQLFCGAPVQDGPGLHSWQRTYCATHAGASLHPDANSLSKSVRRSALGAVRRHQKNSHGALPYVSRGQG